MVSKCLPAGESNPSIGDVLSVGGIPMVEVVPSVRPTDWIYASAIVLWWPNGRISDRAMEVEAVCKDDSHD